MLDLLSPLTGALAAILSATHSAATALGLAGSSASAWVVSLALLVVVVRGLLVPIVVRGVRDAHARAHARPQLLVMEKRFAGRRDMESLQALRDERRRIHREHGVSSWSLAPALLQLPILYALYRVISDAASGHSVGLLDAGLLASAASASILGLHLSSRLSDVAHQSLPAAAALVAVAVVAAALTFLSQRWFAQPMTDLGDQPLMAGLQRWMPALSAAGVLLSAWFVPAGLLLYWCLNNAWTFAQQGVIWRLAPTPGTPAHRRRAAASDDRE